MLGKEITYTDYNDVERKETFFFNLSKAELAEMQLGTTGGWGEMMEKIISAQDTPSLVSAFKDIILKSYGEKSPDGKQFIKSEELSKAFSQTEAYSNLFMELISDDKKAAEFINGIIPAEFAAQTESAKLHALPATE